MIYFISYLITYLKLNTLTGHVVLVVIMKIENVNFV